jgi:antitoxin component YwqK of YwqJK toxin-antitoxin module
MVPRIATVLAVLAACGAPSPASRAPEIAAAAVAPAPSIVRVLDSREARDPPVWLSLVRADLDAGRAYVWWQTDHNDPPPARAALDTFDLRTGDRIDRWEATERNANGIVYGAITATRASRFPLTGTYEHDLARWNRLVDPGKERIVFTGVHEGEFAMFVSDRDGGNPRRLDRDSFDSGSGALSPDGDRVAWRTYSRKLRGHTLAIAHVDGEPSFYPGLIGAGRFGPAWSPDGTYVYLVVGEKVGRAPVSSGGALSHHRDCLYRVDPREHTVTAMRCSIEPQEMSFVVDPTGATGLVATRHGDDVHGWDLEWVSLPGGNTLARVDRVGIAHLMGAVGVLRSDGVFVGNVGAGAIVAVELRTGVTRHTPVPDDFTQYGGFEGTELRPDEPLVLTRRVGSRAEIVAIDVDRLLERGEPYELAPLRDVEPDPEAPLAASVDAWWKSDAPCPRGAHLTGAPPPSGDHVTCALRDGTAHGPHAGFDASGQVWESGAFRRGKRDGAWTWFYPTGRAMERGEYRRGVQHGDFAAWYRNGARKYALTYVDGLEHGPLQFWHDNGQLMREGVYRDGWREGPWREWYDAGGDKLEQSFVGGRVDGVSRGWHRNGKQSFEATSERGRRTAAKTWTEDGGLESTSTWVGGSEHKVWRYYYDDGAKRQESEYVDGVQHGVTRVWDESGRLVYERRFERGAQVD